MRPGTIVKGVGVDPFNGPTITPLPRTHHSPFAHCDGFQSRAPAQCWRHSGELPPPGSPPAAPGQIRNCAPGPPTQPPTPSPGWQHIIIICNGSCSIYHTLSPIRSACAPLYAPDFCACRGLPAHCQAAIAAPPPGKRRTPRRIWGSLSNKEPTKFQGKGSDPRM